MDHDILWHVARSLDLSPVAPERHDLLNSIHESSQGGDVLDDDEDAVSSIDSKQSDTAIYDTGEQDCCSYKSCFVQPINIMEIKEMMLEQTSTFKVRSGIHSRKASFGKNMVI